MKQISKLRWLSLGTQLFLPGVVVSVATVLVSAARAQGPDQPHVRTVAFSPDGKLLASGTGEPKEPGTVTLWNISMRRPLWTYRESAGVPAVAFSPDGMTLAAASFNNTATLLDAATGAVKATLHHPKEVRSLAFSPDGKSLATACWDRLIRVWDVQSSSEKLTCKGHKDRISTVAYSPDGKLLLSAGGSDGAKLWDAATGAEKQTWKHGGFYVACAGFSPDGRWAITGGYDGTVRVWGVSTGELRARFSGVGGVYSTAFSQATRTLAVSSNSREIGLFPLSFQEPTPKELERIHMFLVKLDDDSYEVREAASKGLVETGFVAEPELRRAVKESPSVEVRIRARRAREEMLSKPLRVLHGHTDQVETAAFSPEGSVLASGSKDGTVRLWDMATGKELGRLTPPK
ncbi:MAG TPA: WD40 repeat domain-containing protein [Gemmataceae bacterium]|nr:WD40 repeat domain-containing protein [Gemmataceae bacterium]